MSLACAAGGPRVTFEKSARASMERLVIGLAGIAVILGLVGVLLSLLVL